MRLTEHFSLGELIASDTAARLGIINNPPLSVVGQLHNLAEGLERVRAIVQRPIQILSGYRCPQLNVAVGGSARSAHMEGLAADVRVPGMSPGRLAAILSGNPASLGIDQLILEHPERPADSWVHLGFSPHPRGEVLTGQGSPVCYVIGLPAALDAAPWERAQS